MSPRPTGSANCCTPGCTNPIHFKGLCKQHYARGRTRDGQYQGYRVLEMPKSEHCGITDCRNAMFKRELCQHHFIVCYPKEWLKEQEARAPQPVLPPVPPSEPKNTMVPVFKKTIVVSREAPTKRPAQPPVFRPVVSSMPTIGTFEEEEFEARQKREAAKKPTKRNCQKCKKLLKNDRRRFCLECEPKGRLWQDDGNWIYT